MTKHDLVGTFVTILLRSNADLVCCLHVVEYRLVVEWTILQWTAWRISCCAILQASRGGTPAILPIPVRSDRRIFGI